MPITELAHVSTLAVKNATGRDRERPSTIQVRVFESGAGKTAISFMQEGLPSLVVQEEREEWFKTQLI